jgi:EAL domain-containing protein (putative c-di-GMP-specific phosphodiesterase class I)
MAATGYDATNPAARRLLTSLIMTASDLSDQTKAGQHHMHHLLNSIVLDDFGTKTAQYPEVLPRKYS